MIYHPTMTKNISLIATVLNEGQVLHHLFDSLLAQTVQAQEIVFVDGGSTDNTLAIIQQYQALLPIKLLQEVGCNISQGRNLAIEAASGEIIVATDAGVWIPPQWLENLTHPFQVQPDLPMVAGFFRADPNPHQPFEVAMSAAVLPLADEIQPSQFLPSSRSIAFQKSAWEAVGGYPEWLDYCEDLIFDLRLKAHFGDFPFVPQAYVYFKPRTSLRSFYKQYYLYARGDGKADLWRKRHLIRYLTYLVIIPMIGALGWFVSPMFWIFYLIGGIIYLRQPYRRLGHFSQALTGRQYLQAAWWVGVIRVVGDIAKMIGYPVGWWWRWKNHPPDWKH